MSIARAALAALLLATACSSGTKPAVACPEPRGSLPGMNAGGLPWPAELDLLAQRLPMIGLPALKQEGSAIDYHFNVSVTIEGSKVVLPSNIGIAGEEVSGGRMVTGFVSPIHTHNPTGLVHIHSADVVVFTIGQFFDVWGVTFEADRIGGFCSGDGKAVTVLVDGRVPEGDPRDVAIADGMKIEVAYA